MTKKRAPKKTQSREVRLARALSLAHELIYRVFSTESFPHMAAFVVAKGSDALIAFCIDHTLTRAFQELGERELRATDLPWIMEGTERLLEQAQIASLKKAG